MTGAVAVLAAAALLSLTMWLVGLLGDWIEGR